MSEKNNAENQKKWSHVIAKAWSDEHFKKMLISNPKQALKECGILLPADIQIKVVEDTSNMRHFVIPQKPHGNLSETELKKAVGGAMSFCCLTSA